MLNLASHAAPHSVAPPHAPPHAFDAAQIRDQFPILNQTIHGKPLIYLDSAASAQKPQLVLDALHKAYAETYANVHRGLHYLSEASTDAYEAVRAKVATLINAPSKDEVIFTSGATLAINMIAHCYGQRYLGKDDEILITIADHHANIVPWQLLAERVGARLLASPVQPDGTLDLDIFKSHISP